MSSTTLGYGTNVDAGASGLICARSLCIASRFDLAALNRPIFDSSLTADVAVCHMDILSIWLVDTEECREAVPAQNVTCGVRPTFV